MKCTTRQQCVDKYGPIDFSTGHWSKQNHWIQPMEVPKGFFPGWLIGGTHLPVAHISCNIDMHFPLRNALDAVHSKGLGDLLVSYEGCFNIRMVRGSNSAFSAHSYGLAIDMNYDNNQLGSTKGGFYNHPDFVKCFTDQGFDWGGNFHHRKDPMHFSYCFE